MAHAEQSWPPHTITTSQLPPSALCPEIFFLNFVKIACLTTKICYLLLMWHFCGTHYCQAHQSKICEVLFQLNVKITDNWNSTYTKQHFKEKRILVGPELFFLDPCFPWKYTDDWFHSLPIDKSGTLAQLLLLLRTVQHALQCYNNFKPQHLKGTSIIFLLWPWASALPLVQGKFLVF